MRMKMYLSGFFLYLSSIAAFVDSAAAKYIGNGRFYITLLFGLLRRCHGTHLSNVPVGYTRGGEIWPMASIERT